MRNLTEKAEIQNCDSKVVICSFTKACVYIVPVYSFAFRFLSCTETYHWQQWEVSGRQTADFDTLAVINDQSLDSTVGH